MSGMLVTVLHCAVFAAVLLAAYEDVRFMRIRNTIALAVALLFLPMLALLPLNEVIAHLVVGGVIFAICVALFFAGLLGGGDAKLIGAIALWPSLHELPAFLMVMTFAGGALAIIALVLKKGTHLTTLKTSNPTLFGPENGWLACLERGETVVPYGVAIAIASLVILF